MCPVAGDEDQGVQDLPLAAKGWSLDSEAWPPRTLPSCIGFLASLVKPSAKHLTALCVALRISVTI